MNAGMNVQRINERNLTLETVGKYVIVAFNGLSGAQSEACFSNLPADLRSSSQNTRPNNP